MSADVGLEDKNWRHLIEDIVDGTCTPFLGAGASYGYAPLGGELAERWAEQYEYPLPGPFQLPQVAQYISFTERPGAPKILLRKLFKDIPRPTFEDKDDPHAALAALHLPCYLTTNYDDFMARALAWVGRPGASDHCRWWNGEASEDVPATVDEPLVFHLHGWYQVEDSMVVTELDYLDFLLRLVEDGSELLPTPVQLALAERTLLFVGYSLNDWTTRVLVKSIAGSLTGSNKRNAVAINLEPPADDPDSRARAREFLSGYLGELQNTQFSVFWGTAREFTAELVRRLEDHCELTWESGLQFASDLRDYLEAERSDREDRGSGVR